MADGVHDVELVDVYAFDNAYGRRIAFEYEVTAGEHAGSRVTQSATPSSNTRSKLADILRGLLGQEPTEADLSKPEFDCLLGITCKALVQTETNKSGKPYSSVCRVFR